MGGQVDGWTGGRVDKWTGGQVGRWAGGQVDRSSPGSVQLSVSILFIILGSLVFPCGGMTGGRRPEGRPPQGMVNIL